MMNMEFIKSVTGRGRGDVVASALSETGYVFIDTSNTLDHGWETMVFACDANGENIQYGEDLYADWYENEQEALIGHCYAVGSYGKDIDPNCIDEE